MKFTHSHEWVRIEEKVGTVGITYHAQKELGDVVYIELPMIGKSVRLGEEVAVIESTKAAIDVYSPVSGIILSINHLLNKDIEMLNQFPENEGWLFQIELTTPQELEALMDRETYLALVKK
jgi:glycine cleavage system H protein